MFKEIVNTLIESSTVFEKYQTILNNYAGYLSRTKSDRGRQHFLAKLEEVAKTSEDIFSKARYYAYIFADGSKTATYGLYDWPHDKNYLDRLNMTIKDWLDEQVQWNDGCIGYELFDADMNSLGIIKV